MLSRINNLLPLSSFSFIWQRPKIPVGVSTSLKNLVTFLSIKLVLTLRFKLSSSTYNSFKRWALYASLTKWSPSTKNSFVCRRYFLFWSFFKYFIFSLFTYVYIFLTQVYFIKKNNLIKYFLSSICTSKQKTLEKYYSLMFNYEEALIKEVFLLYFQ